MLNIFFSLGVAMVTSNIATTLIQQSISMSVKKIFSAKTTIKSINDIKLLMKQLDIATDLDVIRIYVENKPHDEALTLAWQNLNNTLYSILKQTESINKKIDRYESLYKIQKIYYGEIDFTDDYHQIEHLMNQLNRRLELLLKIINF